jgi:hypothetical protein
MKVRSSRQGVFPATTATRCTFYIPAKFNVKQPNQEGRVMEQSEINKFICEVCGKPAESISSNFRSCRHEHPSSSGIKKRFYLDCTVHGAINDELMKACDKCKCELASGMSSGGNIVSEVIS